MSQSQPRGTRTIPQVDQPINRKPDGAGAYPTDLVPVARPGDVIQTKPDNRTYVVEAVVPQPGLVTFDSEDGNDLDVNANSTSDKQELTELQQDDGWIAQLRLVSVSEITDGAILRVDWGGRQSQAFTANNDLGVITPETGVEGGDDTGGTEAVNDVFSTLTEYYQWEQEEYFVTVENTTGGQITIQDLTWAGYQMQITEIDSVPSGVQPVVLPTRALG